MRDSSDRLLGDTLEASEKHKILGSDRHLGHMGCWWLDPGSILEANVSNPSCFFFSGSGATDRDPHQVHSLRTKLAHRKRSGLPCHRIEGTLPTPSDPLYNFKLFGETYPKPVSRASWRVWCRHLTPSHDKPWESHEYEIR